MTSNQYMSTKNRLFELLQQFDDILYFPETKIDIIDSLKWEFHFLDFFHRLHCFTDEPNMVDLSLKVQTVFKDALVDFSDLYIAEYFDFYTCKVKNKIMLTKMEIRATYSFVKVSVPISANKEDSAVPELVTEFVHSVAESLPGLVKIDDPDSETMQHVKDLLKELEMLQNFCWFVSDRFIEPQISRHHVTFFSHVLAVAGHAAMLTWLYLPDLDPEEIRVLLSDFLQMKIKPIEPSVCQIYVDVLQSSKCTILQPGWCPHIQNEYAEVNILESILHNLTELPTNGNSCRTVAVKDHLVTLQKMLSLLRSNINNVSMKDLEFIQDIDTVIIDVGLFVYSLYNGEAEKKELMAPGEVNTTLALDLMGDNQRTNTMICPTIRKAFQSNLPKIHGLGCVDFLLNNLEELQRRHSDSLASITPQLQVIQKELENLNPFLQAVAEERHSDLDNIQHCATKMIDKAYEVEYIVDACIRNVAPMWCLECWLLDIIKEITLIRDEVAEIHETRLFGDSSKTVTAHEPSNLARSPKMNEEIVGFEEVIEKLRDQLIKGTRERDVISIVGMPGLGKTTLAFKLYYDRLVVSRFDIRAQCCVSQVYSRKDLLLTLLDDVVGGDSNRRENPADELADELRRALFSKRCLILIDDVWETSVWDDLICCFKDAGIGSRIILTTRNREVADYAILQSEPILLRMLSDDESWELLRKKVFGEESCPPLLTNIGQRIARKCGQLPLSVVLVAGILAKMEKKAEDWEQLAQDLGTHIHKDSRVIIEKSYQNLPYHLRSCFLYFGAFLEDSVMNVSKLIRLWISEGFIKSCEDKSLEDIAEGYLENLIRRNLVMRSKKSYRDKIKACQIHDLLHDFCKEKANEEILVLRITFKWDQSSKSYSRVDCHKQLAHRLSLYGEGYHIFRRSSHWSNVSSVISHIKSYFFDSSDIFRSFKFLKVLDLAFTRIDSFPTDLIYLRYLSALTSNKSILSYTPNCQNLETLVLNIYRFFMFERTLLKMVKLRHLHIYGLRFISENAEGILENSKKLYNLRTLSNPCFSCIRDAELLFSRTPNLQELRCRLEDMGDFKGNSVLNFPSQLETLKIIAKYSMYGVDLPFCISAPNLKSLTLHDIRLQPQQLSGIGSIQNLQVLKLQGCVILKKGWRVGNGEFPQLKVLKLHGFCAQKKWIVADEAFPELERLVLKTCYNLNKIPSCFGELLSLKSIEVEGCFGSLADSAREIAETQEGYGRSDFQVLIIHEGENGNSDYIKDEDDDDDDDDDDDGGSDDDGDDDDDDDGGGGGGDGGGGGGYDGGDSGDDGGDDDDDLTILYVNYMVLLYDYASLSP